MVQGVAHCVAFGRTRDTLLENRGSPLLNQDTATSKPSYKEAHGNFKKFRCKGCTRVYPFETRYISKSFETLRSAE